MNKRFFIEKRRILQFLDGAPEKVCLPVLIDWLEKLMLEKRGE
jgi:hypothetical protein